MRISDWSSDVCSSDLLSAASAAARSERATRPECRPCCGADIAASAGFRRCRASRRKSTAVRDAVHEGRAAPVLAPRTCGYKTRGDRNGVGEGKSVSVRVVLGGRRSLKKKKKE